MSSTDERNSKIINILNDFYANAVSNDYVIDETDYKKSLNMLEFGPLNRRFTVDQDVCIGCKKCTRTGCPAIIFQTEIKKSSIDRNQCLGCSLCSQVCPVKAIHAVGEPCLGKETQKK